MKDSFLTGEPLVDLFSLLESARTGGLLSSVESAGIAGLVRFDFGLRENLRAVLVVVVDRETFGWVLVVAASELLSLSAAFALSRSSEETTVWDPFGLASLSASDEDGVDCSCACALGGLLGTPFSFGDGWVPLCGCLSMTWGGDWVAMGGGIWGIIVCGRGRRWREGRRDETRKRQPHTQQQHAVVQPTHARVVLGTFYSHAGHMLQTDRYTAFYFITAPRRSHPRTEN